MSRFIIDRDNRSLYTSQTISSVEESLYCSLTIDLIATASGSKHQWQLPVATFALRRWDSARGACLWLAPWHVIKTATSYSEYLAVMTLYNWSLITRSDPASFVNAARIFQRLLIGFPRVQISMACCNKSRPMPYEQQYLLLQHVTFPRRASGNGSVAFES